MPSSEKIKREVGYSTQARADFYETFNVFVYYTKISSQNYFLDALFLTLK